MSLTILVTTGIQATIRDIVSRVLLTHGISESDVAWDIAADIITAMKQSATMEPSTTDSVKAALAASFGKVDETIRVQEVLNDLERSLRRGEMSSGAWQDLAKWLINRTKEGQPYSTWVKWYMSDPFNAKNSWRLSPADIRASYPQAFASKTSEIKVFHANEEE